MGGCCVIRDVTSEGGGLDDRSGISVRNAGWGSQEIRRMHVFVI